MGGKSLPAAAAMSSHGGKLQPPGGERKKRRYKPGTVALREIRKYQKNAILIDADKPHMVVVRPDSGDMLENVVWTLGELYKAFGGEEKNGLKVLHPSVRIIQGDGISLETYPVLLDAVQAAGFSVTNVVVGSGGGLLQKVNRDTIRFAINPFRTAVSRSPRLRCDSFHLKRSSP